MNFYQTTRLYNLEDSQLHPQPRKPKVQIIKVLFKN
jgi:hypothetical protein